jgi:hypothetical protein
VEQTEAINAWHDHSAVDSTSAPAARKVEMKHIDVVKNRDGWAGESVGRAVPNAKAPTKAEAVRKAAAVAKQSTEPVAVRIHKADGKFQEEWTYPRGADPRRSES